MNYYADPAERAALIAGMRDLAAYFEKNPGVPAPKRLDVMTFPPEESCKQMRAEIDAIAARIGGKSTETTPDHYTTSQSFGPVEYRVVAICKQHDHNHRASR